MARAVVKLQTRLPVELHARLTRAARRGKRSLHAEMLLRLAVRPETVEQMLKHVSEEILCQMGWLRDQIAGAVREAMVPVAGEIVRKIRNGDVPVLVNEELARINRAVLQDEVRQAMREATDAQASRAAAQKRSAPPRRAPTPA